MAVLKVKFDNILCFNDFVADFSYPKKLVKTTLEGEYLKDFPNIRYRKVNVIVGANATGKTSLGKAIWKTFLFLHNKEANNIEELITDNNKEAYILLDCVFSYGLFVRVEIKRKVNKEILVKYQERTLTTDDTYESVVGRLDSNDNAFNNYISELADVDFSGWNFKFPTIESGFDKIVCSYPKEEQANFAYVLTKVLRAFDPSVDNVTPSNEIDDSFIVTFKNGTKSISITDGERISDIKILSSGSKYAINIAAVIYAIKMHKNGFYFVDEQFSYANQDVEIACLVTMANLLDDGEQLFFTTHDTEVLSLPFPNHSYNFMKKEVDENGNINVAFINAAALEKRNNVNIKNLYDNDFFDVAPNTNLIYELGEK